MHSPSRNRPFSPRARSRMRRGVALAAGIAGIVVALSGVSAAQTTQQRPGLAACPASVADKATCYTGQDANGAYYAIAVPKQWNGSLVVHAHGGPDLGEGSDPERSIGDLDRWSVMVDEGYAWAGSSYRRGGYGTRMAAADTENLRRLFVDEFGKPNRTYVHGQSWGGNVAAKVRQGAGFDASGHLTVGVVGVVGGGGPVGDVVGLADAVGLGAAGAALRSSARLATRAPEPCWAVSQPSATSSA